MGNYVVVESFVKGKSEVISCEDRIVITPYYCAVIDGATSKTPMKILNLTPGFWAAELIKQSIIDLPYDCPLKVVTELITEKIRSCYLVFVIMKYGLLEIVNVV